MDISKNKLQKIKPYSNWVQFFRAKYIAKRYSAKCWLCFTIHKLVYKHSSVSLKDCGCLPAPASPRGKCALTMHLNWLTQINHINWTAKPWWQVNLGSSVKKREILRDFSLFFDPGFFRSFIDSFCLFLMHTFDHSSNCLDANSQKQKVMLSENKQMNYKIQSAMPLLLHRGIAFLFTNFSL